MLMRKKLWAILVGHRCPQNHMSDGDVNIVCWRLVPSIELSQANLTGIRSESPLVSLPCLSIPSIYRKDVYMATLNLRMRSTR
ncbi:hypothetical protein IG631_03202 [Alternaria alternata]|nr:hypothetical protein IG631_03202 [Alternaria alternata]